MKKAVFLICPLILFCLLPSFMKAQDSLFYHKNFIGFAVSELPFTDIRLFYEHRFTRSHGIIFTAGYKIAFRGYTDATQIDLGREPTAWCYRNTATWLYAAVGYRYYFNRKKTIYFSPELFYKTLWADKIMYTYGVGRGGNTLTNVYQVRSMDAQIPGLNILVGKKLRIRFSRGFNMGFDVFAGVTFRLKFLKTTIYGSQTYSRYHDESANVISIPLSPNPAVSNEILPQVCGQFGINLFFSWR